MVNFQKKKQSGRERRRARVRAKVFGTSNRPRLSVFRSHKHIYAQIIDDIKGRTMVAVSDREVGKSLVGLKQAEAVGQKLAEKAQAKKISQVVFDRSGYRYHGRIMALAKGAREKGLKF